MAICPRFRGIGCAQRLMKQAEILSSKNGYHWVRVDTNSTNIPMNNLFKKLNFNFCGTIRLLSKPPSMKFHCYHKAIK